LPVVVRDLPALQRVVLPLLEPVQLLLRRHVHPEHHEDAALVAERALEAHDRRVGALPLLLRRKPLHPLDQHAPDQERSNTVIPPSPGRAGQNRHRK
jgi:hypothetical protein